MTQARRRSGAHYLLVEDNHDQAELVKLAFEGLGSPSTITHVTNGEMALSYLRRDGEHAAAPRPDVVLLDLKLPGIAGHEVLTMVKQDPDLKMIPVIVLTTSCAYPDMTRAYANHANSFLVKPIDFAEFQGLIGLLDRYWTTCNQRMAGAPDRDLAA